MVLYELKHKERFTLNLDENKTIFTFVDVKHGYASCLIGHAVVHIPYMSEIETVDD